MLKYFSAALIFFTFCLINLGGLVHNSGSSLACPDWPLCYGQFFPRMEGGILIEHGHRLLASLVGLMTIFQIYLTRKRYHSHGHIVRLSYVLLVMVVLQGLLGGLTVIYKLPTIVSTAHLGLSMLFFGGLILFNHQISNPPPKQKLSLPFWPHNLKSYVLVGAILVYLQIILGASMRHLGLGGICGFGFENSLSCLVQNDFVREWWPAFVPAKLHMLHRYLAAGITLYLIFLFFKMQSTLEEFSDFSARLGKWKIFPMLIVLGQFTLGILVISSAIDVVPTTLHLGGAALLFASLLKLYFNLKTLEKDLNEVRPTWLSDIISLTKPRLSGLVIVTATIGLLLAPGEIPFLTAVIAILSTSFVVAGACSINCYLEKEVDAKMRRTSSRPIPSERIGRKTGLFFGIIMIGIFLPMLWFFVNPLTAILGALATIIYVAVYTPMKLKSTTALFIGAIPGAIPPVMGWTAVTNDLGLMAWVLFGVLFFWQLPHFLAIAIFYAEDYSAAGIKIVPNILGLTSTKIRMTLYSFLLLVVSVLPWFMERKSGIELFWLLLVGAPFLCYAVYGFFIGKRDEINKKWAKKFFYASLVYLPSILVIMLFFK